jgi:hypothetical protein
MPAWTPSANELMTPLPKRKPPTSPLAPNLLRTVDYRESLAPDQAAQLVSRGPAQMMPANAGATTGIERLTAQTRPAWQQPQPQPQETPTAVWQGGMANANPSLARVAPGAPTMAGREALQNQPGGYGGTVGYTPESPSVAVPRAAWQPNQAAWLSGPLADQAGQAAQQIAQRQATGAANQATMERMQANAAPAFGSRGGTTQPREGHREYLQRAMAFRDGTGPDPGPWIGSPGDASSAPRQPTEAQLAKRAAWQDTKAMRQRMVTAKAQGRPITQDQAMASVVAGSGRGVSDDLAAAAWGKDIPMMRSAERIAGLPYSPEAMGLQRELANSAVLAALAGNQALPAWAMPIFAGAFGGNGGATQTPSPSPVMQMIAASAAEDAMKQNPSIAPKDLQSTMVSQGVDPTTAGKEAGRRDVERARQAEGRWGTLKELLNSTSVLPFGAGIERAVSGIMPQAPAPAGLPAQQLARLQQLAADGNQQAQALLRRNGLLQTAPAKPTLPGKRSAGWADVVLRSR